LHDLGDIVTEGRARRWFVICLGWLVVALPAAGCGRNDVDLTGSVTFAGKPVADGMIELIPADGTPGHSCGARIVDGKYRVPAGAGLQRGGIYKVVLRGFHRQMQPDPMNAGHLVEAAVNYLPSGWGDQSTRRIRILSDGAADLHDFDLVETAESN
jgi:hypothetical protein